MGSVTKKRSFCPMGKNKSLHVSNHRSDGVFQELSKYLWDYYNSGTPGAWSPGRFGDGFAFDFFHTFAWSLGMARKGSKKGTRSRDLSWWSLVSWRWVPQATNLLAESWITQSCFRTFTAIQPKESYGNVQHEKNTSGSFHFFFSLRPTESYIHDAAYCT